MRHAFALVVWLVLGSLPALAQRPADTAPAAARVEEVRSTLVRVEAKAKSSGDVTVIEQELPPLARAMAARRAVHVRSVAAELLGRAPKA